MEHHDARRPYPPPHNAWTYPPPPISRRWFWLAALAGPLAAALMVAGITVLVVTEQKDSLGFLDDEEVVRVVERQCELMTSTVEGLPVAGPPRRRVAVMADQNTAVGNMLERIRKIDEDTRRGDRPLEEWLADWERLVQAREAYAAQVRQGFTGELALPQVDGEDVTVRMDEAASTAGCEVPETLVRPDLDDAVEI